MKVAIGGSRSLHTDAARKLVRFLASLEPGTEILLRRGMNTQPGAFESDVAVLCQYLHLKVKWYVPEPTERHSGRATVFVRDMDLAHDADLILCFIHSAETEYGGTVHLAEKGFEADKPTYGYLVVDPDAIKRWGEHDPDGRYVDLVPTPD